MIGHPTSYGHIIHIIPLYPKCQLWKRASFSQNVDTQVSHPMESFKISFKLGFTIQKSITSTIPNPYFTIDIHDVQITDLKSVCLSSAFFSILCCVTPFILLSCYMFLHDMYAILHQGNSCCIKSILFVDVLWLRAVLLIQNTTKPIIVFRFVHQLCCWYWRACLM